MSELQNLIRKRAVIKGSLTRFKNFLDSLHPEDDRGQFLSRLSSAQGCLERYEEVQMEIEFLDKETNHEQDRIAFEEEYHAAIGKAKEQVQFRNDHCSEDNRSQSRNSNSLSHDSVATAITEVRLPVLNLPKFDGSYEIWAGFKDTFNVLVNENAKLSDVQKFYYLQSCLKGRAAETIEALQISNDNYRIAWDLLEERFQNTKLTVMAHVKSLVDLPPIAKDNAVALRQLLDEYLKHFRALKMLGQPVDSWGVLLIHLITAKFDVNSRRYWEIESNSKDLPTLDQLEKFLKARCQLLEIMSKGSESKTKKVATMHSTQTAGKLKCYHCKEEHSIFRCQAFLKLSVKERKTVIDKLGVCSLCFSRKHKQAECKARLCNKCNKRHSTLLHQEAKASETNNASNEEGTSANASSEVISHALGGKEFEEHVLLSTAKVKILDSKNQSVEARALLDSGSTANYVTERLAKQLGLSCTRVGPVRISGINNSQSRVTNSVSATINSTDRSYRAELSFLILGKITEKLPIVSFNKKKMRVPSGITLADPEFNVSADVDMLLGAQVFYDLFLSGRIELGSLTLRESKLGWLVTGSTRLEVSNYTSQQGCCLSINNNISLQDSLERFWKTEELPENKFLTQEEAECEDNFESTTRRDSQGRFVVRYPMQLEASPLGDSLTGAINRFHHLEKRLQRNEELHKEYSSFLQEYEAAGHMKKIGDLDSTLNVRNLDCGTENHNLQKYYIPHHCVEKATSSTTKLRVVFDASAKSSNQLSLNAILQNGPVVQADLFSVLLRFRKYNVVLSADIKQMFRQILIDEEQQGLQRILWRESRELPLQVYQLKTITYGLKPATYLATRCVKEVALEFQERFPEASRALMEDTYVDDFTSGARDLESALTLKTQVDEILNSACFHLRKWRSNSPKLLNYTDFRSNPEKHFIKDETESKTLGLVCDSKFNTLSSEELAKATTILIKLAQEQEFEKELARLKGSKEVSKDSSILPLNPFIDNEGIIRVGGRLVHSELTFNKKFPIILPKRHLLTKLIVRYYHLKNLHLGANALLASIREEFWPLSGLNTIKGILKRCVTCFKFNPGKFNVKMGNLPKERLVQSRPFTTVSLDYAGPFLIKESKLRNRKIIKTYICIFVCFSTKAMHIELVSDLTTEAFLNALKRFVSRRGLPSELYSDNATNFVAADKDLRDFFQNFVGNESSEFVKNYLAEHKIHWKFMPARSPHFGGLHESAVKSVKSHLKKVMHATVFTIEGICTVLCQIEAILNSRPLYPVSNDPNDLSVLTPAHFLVGQALTALPEPDVTQIAENRLNQYQQIQHRVQSFWRRWNREYLCTLQTRAKWRSNHGRNLQPGTLVLLREDNLPPQCWRLARILQVHHGGDGIVRVVDVKTSTGETSRGITRVCPILVEDPVDFHGGSMDKPQGQAGPVTSAALQV